MAPGLETRVATNGASYLQAVTTYLTALRPACTPRYDGATQGPSPFCTSAAKPDSRPA